MRKEKGKEKGLFRGLKSEYSCGRRDSVLVIRPKLGSMAKCNNKLHRRRNEFITIEFSASKKNPKLLTSNHPENFFLKLFLRSYFRFEKNTQFKWLL